MSLKKVWDGKVSLKGVSLIALISLMIGLGISGSLDWLSPSRAVRNLSSSPRMDTKCASKSW